MIIAIDGPAGSGKSTVAKLVAHALGFQYLDTGAMYRAVAYRALQEGIDLTGGEPLLAIARDEPIEFGTVAPSSVTIGGLDVTTQIRTKEVDTAVSPVSACPDVREALVAQQRIIGNSQNIVMEGRDIGTVVFPNAQLKVFLTASPETRAHRRCEQNILRGIGSTNEREILEAILARDVYDSTRETAPLTCAPDAIEIDSSSYSIDEVVMSVVNLAYERGAVPRIED